MANAKECLYSVEGDCVLADSINKIFEGIRTDLGPDISDEQIYEMIHNRFPKRVSPHAKEFTNLVMGSSCVNCPFRKKVK